MRVGRAGRSVLDNPPATRFLMFARMFVAAALVLGTGAAFASDVSYDQQQIREGTVSLVEGSVRPAAKVTQSKAAAPSMHTGHTMVCSCKM
jgi:hypothetical protein